MKIRREAIALCKKLAGIYKGYPFHDDNWMVMRHWDTKKMFAYIFERDDHIWINVKRDTEWRDFWRVAFPSTVPGFHLDKTYWNSIILDGSVPGKDTRWMITESYDLTKKK